MAVVVTTFNAFLSPQITSPLRCSPTASPASSKAQSTYSPSPGAYLRRSTDWLATSPVTASRGPNRTEWSKVSRKTESGSPYRIRQAVASAPRSVEPGMYPRLGVWKARVAPVPMTIACSLVTVTRHQLMIRS